MGEAMNQDIMKNFLVKLIAISAISAVIWHTLISPQVDKLKDLQEARSSQAHEIDQGEQTIALHADEMNETLKRMDTVRSEISTNLNVNQATNVHRYLQESANRRTLTVSRIEPLRSSSVKKSNPLTKQEIELETKEFRIECVGSYNATMNFFQDLSSGDNIAKVSSFRIIPVSEQDVRMIVQVSVYQLVKVPDTFTKPVAQPQTPVTVTGVPSDEA